MSAWMDRAACAGTDTDVFFGGPGTSTVEARELCASCPVAHDCLAYALRHNIIHGIWGGLSERQRRPLRVERRRAS